MKKSTAISSIVAIVVFFALCALFSGTPENAGWLATLNPIDALNGISFTLSFGFGVPLILGIVLAALALVLPPVAVFLALRHLLRRYDNAL